MLVNSERLALRCAYGSEMIKSSAKIVYVSTLSSRKSRYAKPDKVSVKKHNRVSIKMREDKS
jgi:hypothetical protein